MMEALNNYRVAQAAYDLAAELTKLEIRPPFSGILGLRLMISISDYVKRRTGYRQPRRRGPA
jgi:hypothetical protein